MSSNYEMWYDRLVRLRANYSWPIRFLLWLGFVRIGRKSAGMYQLTVNGKLIWKNVHEETIQWPFDSPSREMFLHLWKFGPRFYVFRNQPGVIKWLPHTVLPLRWGFGFCGFEFGQRG